MSAPYRFFNKSFKKQCIWVGIPSTIALIIGAFILYFTFPTTPGIQLGTTTIVGGMLMLIGLCADLVILSTRIQEYFDFHIKFLRKS